MPVIYIDVLLILNLWVDFLLLSATARLRHFPVRRWRLLIGAFCGAVGSCVLFLPLLSWWITLLIRVVGTLLLCLLTFPVHGWGCFLKNVLVFSVLSAVFSGLASMLWYYVAPHGFVVINGVVYYDAPASLLIVFTALSYGAICLFDVISRRKLPRGGAYTLTVRQEGEEVVCTCLYDSGCTLREPFSGKPAVVMDAKTANRLRPSADVTSAVRNKLRYVPYKTIHGEGLLPAFCPQYMALTDKNGRKRDISGSFLALSDTLENDEYVALVGTDIGELLEG